MLKFEILTRFLLESILLVYMCFNFINLNIHSSKVYLIGFVYGLSMYMVWCFYITLDFFSGFYFIIALIIFLVTVKIVGRKSILESLIAVLILISFSVIKQALFLLPYIKLINILPKYEFYKTKEYLVMEYASLLPVIIAAIVFKIKKVRIINLELIRIRSEGN